MVKTDFIALLNESNDPAVKQASKDLKMWSHLKANKKDLDFMLRFTLLHIFWRGKSSTVVSEDICTSNVYIIENIFKYKKFSAVKGGLDKKFSADPLRLCTFSMTDEKAVTLDLYEWKLLPDLITLTSGNEEAVGKKLLEIMDRNRKKLKTDEK